MAVNGINPYNTNYMDSRTNLNYPLNSMNQPAPQYTTIIWTQGGLSGAMAYPIAPNSTMIFMDRDDMVLFIRSKDISGRENPVTIYDLVKREEPAPASTSNEDLAALVTKIVNDCLDKREKKKKNDHKKNDREVNNAESDI